MGLVLDPTDLNPAVTLTVLVPDPDPTAVGFGWFANFSEKSFEER